MSDDVLGKHGRDHGWKSPDPTLQAMLHIKVFADDEAVEAGDGAFIFAISEDMDGLRLKRVEAYVTTVSSAGIVQVQLRKVGIGDLLSTRVQVDANEKHSKDAATDYVINAPADVAWGDEIAIDVDGAGTGAEGLGVILEFAA